MDSKATQSKKVKPIDADNVNDFQGQNVEESMVDISQGQRLEREKSDKDTETRLYDENRNIKTTGQQPSPIDVECFKAVLGEVGEESLMEKVPDLINSYKKSEKSNKTPETMLDEEIEKIGTTDKKLSCWQCSEETRVEYVCQLQRGQHISMPGRLFTKHIKCFKKLIKLYKHHAIVKEVVTTNGHTVKLKLIHFTDQGDGNKLLETEETFCLRYDELYIVHYKHPRYDADEVVKRAESVVNTAKDYSVILFNCEHFATWCVVDKEESYQVLNLASAIRKLSGGVFKEGSKISKLIHKVILNSSDEVVKGIVSKPCVPYLAFAGVTVLYILYCMFKTVKLVRKYGKKEICKTCLKTKLSVMWLNFVAFGSSSVATLVFVHFAMPLISSGPGIAVLVVMILLSVTLQWAIPSIRKKIQSPFQYGMKKVESFSDIKVGDAIQYTYYGLNHEAIISSISIQKSSTEGVIKVINYALPSVFGCRKIVEESMTVNLEKGKITLLEYDHVNAFTPLEVLTRALKRIGETKWKLASNRSAHLCWWAKVKRISFIGLPCPPARDIGETKSKEKSTLFLGKYEVHLMEEIVIGDVVKYHDSKIGIVIRLTNEFLDRIFKMHVIAKRGSFAKQEEVRIDLYTRSLFVLKYHPAHCYTMTERIDRALAMEGKRCGRQTQLNFVEKIILSI